MSVWVAEEVMRLALRLCSRRSSWTQSRFLTTVPVQHTSCPSLLSHIWATRQSRPSQVSLVKFYSQDNIQSKEKEVLSIPLIDSAIPAETSSENIHRADYFSDKVKKCASPSDVLDLTCQYACTVRQISNCLTHMWSTTKKMSDEQRTYEMQLMFEHPGFELLLQSATKNVVHMRSEDVAYALLSIINLGVPQRSRVVQTLLRTSQEKLNEFDEKSLSILASCLEHMESSPNASAMKDAMRVVVEAKLPRIKKVLSLQTMMRMLGKDAPLDLKKKLEKKALSMTDQFTLPNTQYMITTMATMGFYSKPLMDVCTKKITENLNGIPFGRLLSVLHSCKELRYRDLNLLTCISDYVTSTLDIWTNKQVHLFLSVFESLNFCPGALMEAYAKRVISFPDVLTLKDLLCVLRVYSSLNYDLQHHKEQFLDSLCQVLDSYLPKISAFNLLKSVYSLCLLGHFPSAPLEQLLQSSSIEQFQMDLCLRLDRPPLPCPLTVPPSVLGDPTPTLATNPWFSQSLQSVVRDQADAVLQEMVVVEDFYLLADKAFSLSSRTAVICAPLSGFCYGTSNPRGPLAVKIRHLKILGYNPILVTERELESVSEEERTEILRGRIFPEHHRPDTQRETDQS
uniref:FAST kinase domains 2 n=1 Tax=Echeneis naucrates TaxID=173247 RepID=A0A665TFM8_ECHNA